MTTKKVEPRHSEIYAVLLEIKEEVGGQREMLVALNDKLGSPSDDGKGGTGYVGEIRRNTARLDAIDRFKYMLAALLVMVGAGIDSAREAVLRALRLG